MLVVDLDTLQAVDLLHLIDQVVGQGLDAQHPENVVRNRVAVHQCVTHFHVIPFLDVDVLALGDEEFARLLFVVGRDDDDASLRFVILAKFDGPGDLANDRVVLGLACLEEFRHPWQATRDITGLGRFSGNARQHVAAVYLLSRFHRQDGIDRQEITGLYALGQHHHFALLVAQSDTGSEVGASGLLFPIDHHLAGDAGGLVDFFRHGQAFHQVHVIGDAFLLGDDRKRVGIPFRQLVATRDIFIGLDHELGAIGDAVARPIAALGIDQDELCVAVHDHVGAIAVLHRRAVAEIHFGVVGGLRLGLLGSALHGATDVESAHGQLGAWLADRLGGDDADGLADVDPRAARQVPAVASDADTAKGLAGQRRPYFDGFQVTIVDALRFHLSD